MIENGESHDKPAEFWGTSVLDKAIWVMGDNQWCADWPRTGFQKHFFWDKKVGMLNSFLLDLWALDLAHVSIFLDLRIPEPWMNHTPGFHYIFNMRDLSRVFQVCRHMQPDVWVWHGSNMGSAPFTVFQCSTSNLTTLCWWKSLGCSVWILYPWRSILEVCPCVLSVLS